MATEPFVGAGTYLITPSDTADLINPNSCLWVDVGGALKYTGANGAVDTVTVPAGPFAILVKRVWATGTTATGIHGILS